MTKKVPYHEVVLDKEYKFVSLLNLTMTTCPLQRLQWGKYRNTVKTLATANGIPLFLLPILWEQIGRGTLFATTR